MTIGVSILIAAVGAILRFGVNDRVDDVDFAVIGLILMIAGAVGLVVGLIQQSTARRVVVTETRDVPPPR